MDYEKLLRDKFYIFDEVALKEYIELIGESYNGELYSEIHHILPRSLYPELKDEPENLVRLLYENHVKAHELLFRFTRDSSMMYAYSLMSNRRDIVDMLADLGYTNISQMPSVRKKISMSKTGKSRPDMKGSRYFGANEDKIRNGLETMADKIKGTVIVKDREGNKFRVDVDDIRYVSGELIPFNKGIESPNNSMKSPDNVKKFLDSRKNNDEIKKLWSKEELLTYLIDASNSGKKVTGKIDFSRNYVRIINLTNLDRTEIYNEFVQRLSKG